MFVLGYLIGQVANVAIKEQWQKLFVYRGRPAILLQHVVGIYISKSETFSSLSVDLKYYHEALLKKLEAKPDVAQKEAKYTLTGNLHSLRYWAYEAIPEVGLAFGANEGIHMHRMHSWSSSDVIMTKDVDKILKKKTVTTFNF